MPFSAKLFFRDRLISSLLATSVGMNAWSWWYLISHLIHSTKQVFLHYTVIFGVDLLGDWQKLLYLPICGVLVLLLNFVLSALWYGDDRLLARVLALGAWFFQILMIAASFVLVGINL